MKEKDITNKTNKTIESLFRNHTIEVQIVAFVVRKNPAISSIINPTWFSCIPLGKILLLVRKIRVTLTESTALYQLKSRGVYKGSDDEEVYKVYLAEIFACDISSIDFRNIKVLIQQLYELHESRRCLKGIKGVLSDLKAFDLSKVKGSFRDLGRPMESLDSDKAGEYLSDFDSRVSIVEERVQKFGKEETIGIPTGVVRFDWLIGGLMQEEFGVIAGEPGVGKTAMLICFAVVAWMAGYNVFFASGEMSKYDIQFRVDSNLAGLPSQKFRTGNFEPHDFKAWKDKIEALKEVQSSFFEVVTFPRNFNSEAVENEMLRVQEQRGEPIHLLMLDYLNLMEANNSFGNNRDWKSQADCVWDFKELVADFNGGIGGWTAGQVRDEYIGQPELKLDALKYARAISETAPIVVGLVRTDDNVLYNTMQMQVLKIRNAPPPKKPILLHPNLDIMRIHQEISNKKSLLQMDDELVESNKKKKGKVRRRRLQ